MDTIPYSRQNISEEDIEEVVRVLRSDYLTQGPEVGLFEDSVKEYCGAKYAVAVASGTAALHIAYKALGVGTGDVVWTSPITFAATANAALYCGAEVDFVDVEENTCNMDPRILEEKLIVSEKQGRLPKLIVPVHYAGNSCDMKAISKLAKKYGISVVEDAAHALGADYDNAKVGCSKYSDATIFSFHPVKMITTGEGGMVLTNNHEIAQRVSLLRSHGITRDSDLMSNEALGKPEWYYEQIALGCHYRMTDIQAVLGRSQLTRLDSFVARRRSIALRYIEKLNDSSLSCLTSEEIQNSSVHLFPIQVHSPLSRDELYEKCINEGVRVNVHYIPVYLHPYYRKKGFDSKLCPIAEKVHSKLLSIPVHFDLTDNEQDRVLSLLIKK